ARLSAATFEALIAEQPVLMLALVRGIVARLNRPVSRATKRAATVTVAMTAPVDTAQIIAGLLAEISRHARVEHLSSRRVDTLLVRKDIAQVSGEDAGAPRLAEFLHEVDVVNDHVLLEVDPQMTAWTRRALRQADRAVLVVSSSPGRDECRRVDELIGALDGIDHVRTLAVVHPAEDERPRGTAALIERFAADEVVHVRVGSAADVARLARMISGHGVGLVLGGGGARGFAHLGVYRALREFGVPVDQVGGSSIGAPIGAAIALDLPLDEIEGVVEAQFRRLLDYTLPLVSVLKGRRISRSIDDALGTTGIEDMWLGFYCVSTNLTTSRLQVHRRGRVADAVRASVAIPGVLPPVPAGDHLLVDGGVLDNLPIGQMHDDSRIGTVIAVDVAPPNGPRSKRDYGTSVSGWRALGERLRGRPPSYPRLGAVLLRSMLTGAVRSQHEALRDIDVDLLVDLRLPGVGLLDFERVRPVAQAGYDGARARIEAWAATQPWLAAAS
ncbi:MAG: patatin-like phospholipase family protein, partial [Actinomycetota bacterium]|nr:patatin-like phospholipase family protein [Actinomycetota bacterium]